MKQYVHIFGLGFVHKMSTLT